MPWQMSPQIGSRVVCVRPTHNVCWPDTYTDQDLRVPPSNHFEKLRGNLAGFHSIRVNQQWRLVFRWDGERREADGIYLDDHSYQ